MQLSAVDQPGEANPVKHHAAAEHGAREPERAVETRIDDRDLVLDLSRGQIDGAVDPRALDAHPLARHVVRKQKSHDIFRVKGPARVGPALVGILVRIEPAAAAIEIRNLVMLDPVGGPACGDRAPVGGSLGQSRSGAG
ncbi:MAG TPA: hypothetical protein VGF34_00615 [Stellaceae bacterium]